MSDIVERLRAALQVNPTPIRLADIAEAADEIEVLRAESNRLALAARCCEAENERLRAELVETKKYNGYHQQVCHLEIERLEAALQEIADRHKEFGASYIARMALNEKAEKPE